MDELRVRIHADLETSTMDIDEAASVLDLSPDVVWRYVRAGDLAHIRVQGTEAIEYRILSKDVYDLQTRLHGGAEQSVTPGTTGDGTTPQLLRRIAKAQSQQEQPANGHSPELGPDARPKMTLVRPPAGPTEQAPDTVTFASPTGPLPVSRTPEGSQPAPDSAAPAPIAGGKPDAGLTTAHAATSSSDASGKASESPSPAAAPTSVPPPAANPDPIAQPEADSRPKRPALPPINSIVTVTGSAVHHDPQPAFDQNAAMQMLQSFMESLVAPITAANERLADENTRLLELARMQSQALDKASSERVGLMERLAVLPAEMQKLYERLGTLQAEVHRLEQENQLHAKSSYQKAWGKQSPSWWRRLLGIG
ncbi:MAG: hypothetical protein JWO42_704 [Chloroflexi bacterium]|nr:hypothetical protein [Chloroflexota bacterium]